MPNQEVMREWVSRLRSGDYNQGSGKLSFTDPREGNVRKHCCLGVLSDMAAEQGVIPAPFTTPEQVTALVDGTIVVAQASLYHYTGENGTNTTMPPEAVYEWAHLHPGNPMEAVDPRSKLTGQRLAYLNDSGKSFSEIADLIEEHLIDLPEDVEIPDSPADISVEEKEEVNA